MSALNTTLDIYLFFKNGHKSTHTRSKVCSNLTKCTTTIDFRLTRVFFINLEQLSHPTLVLLFIIWKGKCWLKVPWTFCQNNTVMLAYSRNHAPGILLWQCSCHGNEKQNSESNLTSAVTMELNFFFSFRSWFLHMTWSAVTSSMLKTLVKFWGTSFKFW